MELSRYLSERERLIEAAAPGIDPARRLASLTDDLLAALAESAAATLPTRTRWALIALGGYGAGALLPASDLDLLIASDAPPTTLKPFAEELLYPLWDAGLSVGHQVRSRRDQLASVRADTVTLTATLTGRVIAGDERLGTRLLADCARDAHRRRREVLAALADRPRPGTPFLLEPDLKEGAGGRRDYDELTWTAAVLDGQIARDPWGLVEHGLLDAGEWELLSAAADVVAAARWELHRAGESGLMTLEVADDLATDPTAVQQALADTAALLEAVRERVAGRAGEAVTALTSDEVLALAGSGLAGLPALQAAAWSGRLEHLLPGFRDLMLLRRPGLAHTLTVGAHSLSCATRAADLLAAPPDDDPVLAASIARIPDRNALLVAALTHDAAKATPGADHGPRGADGAREAAERFGLSPGAADHAAALVRHHLALAETASRIDLDDAEVVAAAARFLGNPALLAPLHVLTVADSQATGPGGWSEWHAALVGTLVRRLDAAMTPDVDGIGLVPDPAEDARLAALVARLAADRAPGAHALDVSNGPIPGTFRVTIAAHDRPGLLATLAGTFALAGLDILGGHSASVEGGATERRDIALDTFVVTSATLAPVGTEAWNRLERTLTAALTGRFAVAVRLAERRRHYAPRASGVLEAHIDEDPRGATLRVRAPDRVGLLHDIARSISEAGLDVRSLTATSRAGWAEDTFRLTVADATGTGALGQLAMRLREL